MLKNNLGCYVSSAGGLYKIIEKAKFLGIHTVMTHPSPPQRWNSKPFEDTIAEQFNTEISKLEYKLNVFFHGIYLINLASLDKKNYHLSKLSILHHLRLLIQINGVGVVFHPGSFKDTINEDEGFKQISAGINWIFSNLDLEPISENILLLECSAGSGRVVGSKFEDLAKIYEGVDDKFKKYVGFCLDTQHMFASGYDIVNGLEDVLSKADSYLGFNKINLIHLNDSKTELGSNKDRHENLGDGLIGNKALQNFVNHELIKDKFIVMETPALESLEGAKQEIEKLSCY